MKEAMRVKGKHVFHLMWVTMLLMFSSLLAQEEVETQELDFSFKYFKRANGTIELMVHADASNEEGYYAVEGLPVTFSFATDSLPFILGIVTTDVEGNAVYRIEEGIRLFRDEEGYIDFSAAYDGNTQFEPANGNLRVREVNLNMELKEEDSVRTVLIQAYWINKEGEEVPISEDDILIYVKGMFSYLQIADGYLEEGMCEIEFPADIPGNRNGELDIYARFVEHDDYGTVEAFERKEWGLIPHYLQDMDGKLWTSMAPTWMIVLLIILLSGVWGHYVYAVIQMIRIRKTGKQV